MNFSNMTKYISSQSRKLYNLEDGQPNGEHNSMENVMEALYEAYPAWVILKRRADENFKIRG